MLFNQERINISMESDRLAQKVSWYWQRLKRMSLPELNYRLKQACRIQLMRAGFLAFHSVSSPEIHNQSKAFIENDIHIDGKQRYLSAADVMLNEGVSFFESKIAVEVLTENWNRDPKSGIVAPLAFGPSLDYRDQSLVGDIKYLWEPSRNLFLVPLAQAYRISGEHRYLEALKKLLDSWIRQCPYLKGPHWTSSLELGIRLINWSIVWQLIGGLESPVFEDKQGRSLLNRWLKTIFQHAHFIRYHFSRYSSANNHLIGEAAGLFVACLNWPYWTELNDWRDISSEILVGEIGRQNADDGVNLEQAISYQQFVLDFFIIAGLAARANKMNFPSFYWSKIEDMIAFVGSMMDVGGNMPMIGDSDDGYVVQLSPDTDFCPYKSLLATGAVLFDRADFKAKAGKLDSKTVWLLGDTAVDRFNSIRVGNEAVPVQHSFPKGGYFLMGVNFNTPQEIKCIVDCGPLGYHSIAAHGHADALSLYLSVNGNEILIDPGTYAYHSQTRWRNYFRGTSAHNTVRIDGMDQSQISGNFMWASKAEAVCRVFETGDSLDHFMGYHDGYRRLKDPVLHEREIKFDKQQLEFEVSDCLNCKAQHQVERFFHFSEHCRVELAHGGLNVFNNGSFVEIRPLQPGCRIDLYYGDETLPMGWTSRHYDRKTPSYSAVFRDDITGLTCLQTSIRIHPNVNAVSLRFKTQYYVANTDSYAKLSP